MLFFSKSPGNNASEVQPENVSVNEVRLMQPSSRPDGSEMSAVQSRKVDPMPFKDTMSLNSSFGSSTSAEHLSNKKSTAVTLAQPANISPARETRERQPENV